MDPSSPSQDDPVGDDPLIGQLVGDRYEILAALARGGMGRVYRAMQVQLGREVALKVLDTSADVEPRLREDFTRRFLLEASSLAKLTHPNTIVIYDYGPMGESAYFIAMELLQGRTLRQLIKAEGALDAERTIRLGVQIAGSLAEAHDHGLVHRDLKPGNIFLTRRGDDTEFAKVLDFGLVKQKREEDNDASHTGFMVGTPRYMAPEQIVGDPVGPPTDVYGLGATLYHMLAGRPPFEADNRFELLVLQADSMPEPISAVRPMADLPAGLEQVVLRCLRKRPKDRYANMRELAAALVSCSSYSGSFPFGVGGSSPGLPRPLEAASAGASGHAASDASDVDSTRLSKPRPRPEPPAALPPTAEPSPAPPSAETSAVASSVSSAEPPTASAVAPSGGRAMMVGVSAAVVVSVVALAVTVGILLTRPDPTPPAPVLAPAPAPAPAPTPVVAPSPSAPAETRVQLTTEPPTARVRRDEVDLGDTPLTLLIPEGESWQVTVSADGHETRTVAVQGGQGQLHVRLAADRARPTGGRRGPATGGSSRRSTDNRDPWAEP